MLLVQPEFDPASYTIRVRGKNKTDTPCSDEFVSHPGAGCKSQADTYKRVVGRGDTVANGTSLSVEQSVNVQ